MFSHPMSRRRFVEAVLPAIAVMVATARRLAAADRDGERELRSRIRGLLLGSFIGDAVGGPVEFQDPDLVRGLANAPHAWGPDERLDNHAISAATARLRLRGYGELRPEPEPYAHWTANAPPGTITDDSRHKLILLAALHEAERSDRWPLDRETLARAFLDWPQSRAATRTADTRRLCAAWLGEWESAARWVLGDRDPARSLPPERMWGGLPTCCGQMSLLPLAALHTGDPDAAYRHAYELGFFDNGFGKDLNCALVAGLAVALTLPAKQAASGAGWDRVLNAMRTTDPYAYGKVPWVKRTVDRWLDFTRETLKRADGRPARVFADLDDAFRDTIKWEAQVPFVVAVAALSLCPRDPLAALQLSIEWGHDTDSYAQIVGGFVGALHGGEVFPAEMRAAVLTRVRDEYAVDVEQEADWLAARGSKALGPAV